jgi:hypothetical protein
VTRRRRTPLDTKHTSEQHDGTVTMPKGKPKETTGWTSFDTMVVGIAAGVGVTAALVAQFAALPRVQALVGLALVFTIAYLSSSARRAID